jgi:hypothetical protein
VRNFIVDAPSLCDSGHLNAILESKRPERKIPSPADFADAAKNGKLLNEGKFLLDEDQPVDYTALKPSKLETAVWLFAAGVDEEERKRTIIKVKKQYPWMNHCLLNFASSVVWGRSRKAGEGGEGLRVRGSRKTVEHHVEVSKSSTSQFRRRSTNITESE